MSLSHFFRRRSSYALQWLIILLILCIPLGRFVWTQTHLPHRTQSASSALTGRPGVDWFLILHLPDMTAQYESGIPIMRGRFGEWLDVLVQAGYHPMLLSEVYARLGRDRCLPEKTVVLLFSPAYRTTLDVVGPLLGRRKLPAVWLTDGHALDRLDRRFVTYETTRRMKHSGLWDVGFSARHEMFRLESLDYRPTQFGSRDQPAWNARVGALATNWGPARDHLNFLTVIADWTADDLIHRLRAETPVEDPTALVTGLIQNREWGLSLSTTTSTDNSFKLDAPLDKKASRLFWLCTRHRPDFTIQMQVQSLLGSLWLRLRYDEDSGDGLFISRDGNRLTIQQRQDHAWHSIFSGSMPRHNARLGIDLRGSEMNVSMNGTHRWTLHTLSTPAPVDGIVELYVSDRMRGVARADGVRLLYTPHTEMAGQGSSS